MLAQVGVGARGGLHVARRELVTQPFAVLEVEVRRIVDDRQVGPCDDRQLDRAPRSRPAFAVRNRPDGGDEGELGRLASGAQALVSSDGRSGR